jgi:hypothetical protein
MKAWTVNECQYPPVSTAVGQLKTYVF